MPTPKQIAAAKAAAAATAQAAVAQIETPATEVLDAVKTTDVVRTPEGAVHQFLTENGAVSFRLEEERVGKEKNGKPGKAYRRAFAKLEDGTYLNFLLSTPLMLQLRNDEIDAEELNACDVVSSPSVNPNTGELTTEYFIQRPAGSSSTEIVISATAEYKPKAKKRIAGTQSFEELMAAMLSNKASVPDSIAPVKN